MVASRYPNHPQPLWNLPGGRQLPGELLEETVVREVFEETRLRVEMQELAYVSESYDRQTHVLNVAFRVACEYELPCDVIPAGGAADETTARDHIVAAEWVPLARVHERITVAVVREPLLAFLERRLGVRYAGYHNAGITIEWPSDSL